MDVYKVYLFDAVLFLIFVLLAFPLARGFVVNSLESALMRHDFKKFDGMIDKWYVKFFLPSFNVDFLRLSRAMESGDKEETAERLSRFDGERLKEKQRENVYLKGFEYYVSEEDKPRADEYYEKIKSLDNPKLITYADRVYDIYVLKGWKYLDELIGEAETAKASQKVEDYSMISDMYKNKGDVRRAKEYSKKTDQELNSMMAKK